MNAAEDLVAEECAHLKTANTLNDEFSVQSHIKNIGEIYRTANALGFLFSVFCSYHICSKIFCTLHDSPWI